jgi:hypothetical protein
MSHPVDIVASHLLQRLKPQQQISCDSPLEGNGFEISVPRQIGSGFNTSVGLRSIERWRRGIIRAVVGLGKPIELFRGLKEHHSPPK